MNKPLNTPGEWNRLLWAVEFINISSNEKPMLLGVGWIKQEGIAAPRFKGEARHPILTPRKADALAICRELRGYYADYPKGHGCRNWRFKPVRVHQFHERVK